MISVLMPTYNRAEYLAEAVESVLGQTYTDWELIIQDDGSTDSTHYLLDYYERLDSRIKCFSNQNVGIAGARNTAFSRSEGGYIAVMDSDDLMAPNRLERSLKLIKKKDVDVVHSAFLQADEHGTVSQGVLPVPKITREGVRDNQLPAHVTIMAKRKCFIEHPYRVAFEVNDDQALLQDWYLAGYTFAPSKDPWMIVRYHSASTSNTRDEEIRKTQELLRKELDAHQS